MNRPTKTKLNERRREVANYVLKGWTQADIARQMNITVATVSRDLAAVHESWRERPICDIETARCEELQKIDLVEAEAWAAWQRSQECQRSASLSHGKTGESSRGKHQFGDTRYLDVVNRCIALRGNLIGLKRTHAPPADDEDAPMSADQNEQAYQDYLLLREYFEESRRSQGELQQSPCSAAKSS